MLSTSLSTYTGQLSNNLPHGEGSKLYKTGHTLSCTWVQGCPEGPGLLQTPSGTFSVTFKKGNISRIHFTEDSVCLNFPYKFISTPQGFQEVLQSSDKSWYSALRLPMKYTYYEKPFNKKLSNVKKIKLFDGSDYFGESFEDCPLGFGILIENENVYIGKFCFPEFSGYICCGPKIKKGKFDFLRLNGFGYEKLPLYGVKYEGNYVDGLKEGKFSVFFDEFRAEVYYKSGENLNPVRYYKKDKFLIECNANHLIFTFDRFDDFGDCTEMYELKVKFMMKVCNGFEEIRGFFDSKKQLSTKTFQVINSECLDWQAFESQELNKIKLKLHKDSVSIEKCHINSKETFTRIIYNDHEFYKGTCLNQQRQGQGSFFRDGKIYYRGNWKSDQFHGKGLLFVNDYKIKGLWESGNLIRVFTVYRVN